MNVGGSTKGQKRLNHILERIPVAREQLLTAIDVDTLLEELDPYKVKLADWLQQRGILD